MESHLKFLLCASGIFISFFYFGILQEKINKGKYPLEVLNENGTKTIVNEKYTYALSLVLCQCFMGYVFAKGTALIRGTTDNEPQSGMRKLYGAAALTYLLAMVSSNMSLQWISYPAQIVGKSAKPIPVMLLGVLIGNKSYSYKKYVSVLLVVIGVILFMYKDSKNVSTVETRFGFGELLLLLSLIMDGITGGFQEIMRAKPSRPSGEAMMLNINFWACIYLVIAVVFSGEVIHFSNFVSRHPQVIVNLLSLSCASAIGQHFIYIMVYNFGPLPVSTVTTLRKFVNVLASVLIFGNSLSSRQWIGTVIVFGALLLDSYYSNAKKQTSKSDLSK